MPTFRPATKTQSRLRMALMGPSGSGKTFTALAIATALDLGPIALIDTERGSASKYANRFKFDVLELTPPYSVQAYIEAMEAATGGEYGVLVIDSLSHAWAGEGGLLEQVDAITARDKNHNSYAAWKDITPQQQKLINTLLSSPLHVLATMRSKMAYQTVKLSTGKTAIEKLGMQPIQRDGVEYEFDIVGDLDQENTITITKTRASALENYRESKPGAKLAGMIREWLLEGVLEPHAYAWYPHLAMALRERKLGLMAALRPLEPEDAPKPGNVPEAAARIDAAMRARSMTVEDLVTALDAGLAADDLPAKPTGKANAEAIATANAQANPEANGEATDPSNSPFASGLLP